VEVKHISCVDDAVDTLIMLGRRGALHVVSVNQRGFAPTVGISGVR